MPGTRGDGGGLAPLGGTGATADQGSDAVAERLVHDLRTDEVDVTVDPAGRDDLAVAGDDLGGRPDHEIWMDAVHRVRVPRLAQRDDPAVPNP